MGKHKHGHAPRGSAGQPTYKSWLSMKERCDKPTNASWRWYGGRGIAYCVRWAVFENFLADMGERPSGTTLDRKDPDQDYGPDNCRWATSREQAEHRRPRTITRPYVNAVWIEALGQRLAVADWEARTGISRATICGRLARGWSADRAISVPPNRKHATKARRAE